MNRHEQRRAEREARRMPLPPARDPDLCDVCDEKIAEGATCRTLFDVGGGFPTLYGHAACIDGVIANNVANRGAKYLGDVSIGPE